jgi:hypothetical protein
MASYTPRTAHGQRILDEVRAMRETITANQRQHQISTAIRLYASTGDTRHLAAANVTVVDGKFFADGQEVNTQP